ncbi:IclR family transcriptional regulator [Burkholderia seminalis]|uniref:IclR family transcriptional regulator n=2 Tax=Burkholderia cepacia complex TaxID=87882 RepID=A0A8A8DF55_9BURK|nr:IclR family transcriptional regulator [Burkholderia seminalis]QTO23319.1 IclR family transcriptional regulator [Burkholderia seminalis]
MATSVPAAARTMAVFEIFAREKRELLKSELARLLDLPESSCSDLLGSLEALGYVSRTVSTKRYYPTRRLVSIASAISKHDEMHAFGREATALLSERTGETCYLGEIDQTEVRIIATHEGIHPLRYVVQVGDRVTCHATAIGKSLLGEMPAEERSRILRLKPLRALTANTKVKPEQIEQEVDEFKGLGWYQAVREGRDGLSSFAVSGWIGERLVGISITGPSERFAENHAFYVEQLLQVRQRVFGVPATQGGADAPEAALGGETGGRRGRKAVNGRAVAEA